MESKEETQEESKQPINSCDWQSKLYEKLNLQNQYRARWTPNWKPPRICTHIDMKNKELRF